MHRSSSASIRSSDASSMFWSSFCESERDPPSYKHTIGLQCGKKASGQQLLWLQLDYMQDRELCPCYIKSPRPLWQLAELLHTTHYKPDPSTIRKIVHGHLVHTGFTVIAYWVGECGGGDVGGGGLPATSLARICSLRSVRRAFFLAKRLILC